MILVEDTPKQECEQCGDEYSAEADHCPSCEGKAPAGEDEHVSWTLQIVLLSSVVCFAVIWLAAAGIAASPLASALAVLFTPVFFCIALLSVFGIISKYRIANIIGWFIYSIFVLHTLLLINDILRCTTYDLPVPLDRWYYTRNIGGEWPNFPHGKIKEINGMCHGERIYGEILYELGKEQSISTKQVKRFARANGWKSKEQHDYTSKEIKKIFRILEDPDKDFTTNYRNFFDEPKYSIRLSKIIFLIEGMKRSQRKFWIRDNATCLWFERAGRTDGVHHERCMIVISDDGRRMAVYIDQSLG